MCEPLAWLAEDKVSRVVYTNLLLQHAGCAAPDGCLLYLTAGTVVSDHTNALGGKSGNLVGCQRQKRTDDERDALGAKPWELKAKRSAATGWHERCHVHTHQRSIDDFMLSRVQSALPEHVVQCDAGYLAVCSHRVYSSYPSPPRARKQFVPPFSTSLINVSWSVWAVVPSASRAGPCNSPNPCTAPRGTRKKRMGEAGRGK